MINVGSVLNQFRADVSLLGALLCALFAWAADHAMYCAEVARQRRRLARLDDRALKDIGISRADALNESSRGYFDVPDRLRRGSRSRGSRAAAPSRRRLERP